MRTACFALLFALVAWIQVAGYRNTYPTRASRLAFAQSFGHNKAIRLFYGVPHDLLTVGGYAAWRVGGVLSIIAAVWGLMAAVRALRAEEEAGRQELVLSGAVDRRSAYVAALGAIGAATAILWAATLLGLVAGRLPLGGSAYLALAVVSPIPVFVGLGALTSQLVATRRLALRLGLAALVAMLLVRVVADTASSLAWLRWATPLGWVEELQPFAGPRPAVLLLFAALGGLLLLGAGAIAVHRDVGRGLLPSHDSAPPRLHLLGSPFQQALRDESGALVAWLVGIGFFALITGLLSTSFSPSDISRNLREQLRKLGGASITTPSGALGFYFLLFVLALSLFACSQIAAARREEAAGRLEMLLALPAGRASWLRSRLLLAAAAGIALALAAGALAWAGAAAENAAVSLPRMLEAGANCLPAALLFLALGALAFALAPRVSAGIAYGLVSVAFLWELFGALLSAPSWLLGLSPFHHVGLVPAQPMRVSAAVVMLAVAAASALVAVWGFRRRDLVGA